MRPELGDRQTMVKKKCRACGRAWALAKRMCTCGHLMVKPKTMKPKSKKGPKKKPFKQCSKCGERWSTNKTICTSCGHNMIAARTPKRKSYERRNCSTCGLRLGGTHVCKKKKTLILPDRAAKNRTGDLPVSAPATPSRSRKIPRPKCGVCNLRKQISQVLNNAPESVDKLKLALKDIQQKAQKEIAEITAAVQQVKTFVTDFSISNSKCAFAMMKAASANLSTKAKQPVNRKAVNNKKTAPKQLDRSKLIIDGQRAKRDACNDLLLQKIVLGTITLVPPAKHTSGRFLGRVVRPDVVAERHKAARRMTTATRGLLDAAQGDGKVLVWIVNALYQIDGFRQAFDAALLREKATV